MSYIPSYGASPVQGRTVRLHTGLGTAAGDYTATIKVPAYAMLQNVGVHCVAVWNHGDSDTLIVGDDTDPDGFFTSVDAAATDLTAGQSVDFMRDGGVDGAYGSGTSTHWNARYSTSERTITYTLTGAGTAASTGDLICYATWIQVPTSDIVGGPRAVGTFVAS